MSQTQQHRSQCTSQVGCELAAARVGGKVLGQGVHQLFDGSRSGLGIQLPKWKYPIVVDLASGSISADDYNGRWGDLRTLQDFKQGYTTEMVKKTAQEQRHRVEELVLSNGEIELRIHVGGADSADELAVGPQLV